MTRFRLLRPIAVPGVAGTVGASGGLTIGSGPAPNYDLSSGAAGPGWVYQASYAVGVAMTLDFGAPINSPDPNGYSYQVLRNGSTVVASGSGVSNFPTYTPVAGDAETSLSFWVTASNGAGTSSPAYAAAVTVTA